MAGAGLVLLPLLLIIGADDRGPAIPAPVPPTAIMAAMIALSTSMPAINMLLLVLPVRIDLLAPKLGSLQNAFAVPSSFGQSRCQSLDNGVLQSLLLRARADFVNEVGDLPSHGDKSSSDQIRISPRFARELLPLTQANLVELVRAPDFHGELDLPRVDVIVRKNASYVVERRKPYVRAASQKQGIVLGVSVGPPQ